MPCTNMWGLKNSVILSSVFQSLHSEDHDVPYILTGPLLTTVYFLYCSHGCEKGRMETDESKYMRVQPCYHIPHISV